MHLQNTQDHTYIHTYIHIIQFNRHRCILYNDILQFTYIEQVTLILKAGAWRNKVFNMERICKLSFSHNCRLLKRLLSTVVLHGFLIISTIFSHDIPYHSFERYTHVASDSYV